MTLPFPQQPAQAPPTPVTMRVALHEVDGAKDANLQSLRSEFSGPMGKWRGRKDIGTKKPRQFREVPVGKLRLRIEVDRPASTEQEQKRTGFVYFPLCDESADCANANNVSTTQPLVTTPQQSFCAGLNQFWNAENSLTGNSSNNLRASAMSVATDVSATQPVAPISPLALGRPLLPNGLDSSVFGCLSSPLLVRSLDACSFTDTTPLTLPPLPAGLSSPYPFANNAGTPRNGVERALLGSDGIETGVVCDDNCDGRMLIKVRAGREKRLLEALRASKKKELTHLLDVQMVSGDSRATVKKDLMVSGDSRVTVKKDLYTSVRVTLDPSEDEKVKVNGFFRRLCYSEGEQEFIGDHELIMERQFGSNIKWRKLAENGMDLLPVGVKSKDEIAHIRTVMSTMHHTWVSSQVSLAQNCDFGDSLTLQDSGKLMRALTMERGYWSKGDESVHWSKGDDSVQLKPKFADETNSTDGSDEEFDDVVGELVRAWSLEDDAAFCEPGHPCLFKTHTLA